MSLLKYLTKKDAKGDSRLPSSADVSNALSLPDKAGQRSSKLTDLYGKLR